MKELLAFDKLFRRGCFTEIGHLFHNKYILNNKKTLSKLKSDQYPV